LKFVSIVIALLALSAFLPILSHAFATQPGPFYLDPTLTTNSACAHGESSLDYNQAPSVTTQTLALNSPAYCSAANNSILCPDCPYNGPTFNVSSVTLNLYVTNASGDFFTVTVYDDTTGNLLAVTPDYLYASSVGSACTLDTFTIPLNTQTDAQDTVYTGHSYDMFFFFPTTQPNKTATICTGGSSASNLVFNGSPLVTPEFPLGTIISILAPFAAIAAYFVVTKHGRDPPSWRL
jgi:hypothetical protein